MYRIIVDLDDTLCDIEHRREYYAKNWEKYNQLAIKDPVNSCVYDYLLTMFYKGYHIIILTGRMERYRSLTEKWISENIPEITIDRVVMKDNADSHSSVKFKSEWIESYCDDGDIVIDDRQEIAECCRQLGINYYHPSEF